MYNNLLVTICSQRKHPSLLRFPLYLFRLEQQLNTATDDIGNNIAQINTSLNQYKSFETYKYNMYVSYYSVASIQPLHILYKHIYFFGRQLQHYKEKFSGISKAMVMLKWRLSSFIKLSD